MKKVFITSGPGNMDHSEIERPTFENRDQGSELQCLLSHGWASAEQPRSRVNVKLFLRHIRDLSR